MLHDYSDYIIIQNNFFQKLYSCIFSIRNMSHLKMSRRSLGVATQNLETAVITRTLGNRKSTLSYLLRDKIKVAVRLSTVTNFPYCLIFRQLNNSISSPWFTQLISLCTDVYTIKYYLYRPMISNNCQV